MSANFIVFSIDDLALPGRKSRIFQDDFFFYHLLVSNGMDESSQDQGKNVPADEGKIIASDAVDLPQAPPVYRPRQRSIRLPFLLFVATCLSTFYVGALPELPLSWTGALVHGLLYAVPLMTILLCHEMGHFVQSYRYGVFATWPYFIPVPLPPIGTMGAVIAMEPRMGHRRALFDIGITGPLAGLIPTIIFCIVGIRLSQVTFIAPGTDPDSIGISLGVPLLFTWLTQWFGKPIPANCDLILHPIAFAGWVGLLITSLNLIPIGQLDGGHILYALLKKKAHYVSTLLLVAAFIAVVRDHKLWSWGLMLVLLLLMGPRHPPTADDDEPLGIFRYLLGWLTLAFILIGFTPHPFRIS